MVHISNKFSKISGRKTQIAPGKATFDAAQKSQVTKK
jgi:hypothetical protein